MTKMPKSRAAAAAAGAALFLLLEGCDDPPPDGTVRVEQAWIRLPAAGNRPGAAYFTIEAGSEGTKLIGLSTPAARWIELHESVTKDGVTKMKRRKEMEFPSRGKLVFEPGGGHAMLFGLNPRVKPGDTIPLTLSFNVVPPVTVEAEVRAAGEGTHEGH